MAIHGYHLEGLLGEGSFGQVWKVIKEGKTYAMKKFYEFEDMEFFPYTEVFAAINFDHPNLIKGVDYFFEKNVLYLVMEIANFTLKEYINTIILPEDGKLRLIYELLSALAYLQENNFYHCDIKSSNILVKDDTIKLADFGKVNYNKITTSLCQSLGTFSPQDLFTYGMKYREETDFFPFPIAKQNINENASDMWAAGVVCYEIITGESLFLPREYKTEAELERYFMDKLTEYINNPRKFLQERNIDEKWMPLLLSTLQPDQNLRVDSAAELLKHELFIGKSYNKPIRGFNPWKQFTINVVEGNPDNYVRDILTKLPKSYNNPFVLSSAVTLFYYIFSKIYTFTEDELKVYTASCFYLMGEVYDVNRPNLYKLASMLDIEFSQIQYLTEFIFTAIDARVFFYTFATLAYSEAFYEKNKKLLFEYKDYAGMDLLRYVTLEEAKETPTERDNREPISIY